MNSRWHALKPDAQASLSQRDYGASAVAERLRTSGVEVGEIAGKSAELKAAWIPGVEIFARRIFVQRHRGFFGEFARQDEGTLAAIGLWPRQWATARMFAGTLARLTPEMMHVLSVLSRQDRWACTQSSGAARRNIQEQRS